LSGAWTWPAATGGNGCSGGRGFVMALQRQIEVWPGAVVRP